MRKDFIERLKSRVNVLEETIEEIKDEYEDPENLDESELHYDAFNRIYQGILSVKVKKTYEILLSYGSPSDGFKIICNNNNELEKVLYFFADWGTYEEEVLREEELENFINAYSGVLESNKISW